MEKEENHHSGLLTKIAVTEKAIQWMSQSRVSSPIASWVLHVVSTLIKTFTNAHIIKSFLLIEWVHETFCSPFGSVWWGREMNIKIDDARMWEKGSFLPAIPGCGALAGGPGVLFQQPVCRKKKKSPTLISQPEVNCSLICNFFVHVGRENWRSVYRFSGLWPGATHHVVFDVFLLHQPTKREKFIWLSRNHTRPGTQEKIDKFSKLKQTPKPNSRASTGWEIVYLNYWLRNSSPRLWAACTNKHFDWWIFLVAILQRNVDVDGRQRSFLKLDWDESLRHLTSFASSLMTLMLTKNSRCLSNILTRSSSKYE